MTAPKCPGCGLTMFWCVFGYWVCPDMGHATMTEQERRERLAGTLIEGERL